MQEENAGADAQNGTEDLELHFEDSLGVDERVEALKKQNAKLFERAKTAEGFIKQPDGSWVKKEKPQAVISDKQEVQKPSDILKSPEFKLHRMGYLESEIDLIMHNGGMAIVENKTHPVMLGIERSKEQRRAEEAAGSVSDKSGQSEIERKYTVEQMKNMKPDELANLIGYANTN